MLEEHQTRQKLPDDDSVSKFLLHATPSGHNNRT